MKNLILVAALVALHAAFTNSTGCQQFIDVIAVVDGSDSVGRSDFDSVQDSLRVFVSSLGVSSSVRFGVVVYSSEVGDVIPLSGDASSISNQIDNLNHTRLGTRTDLGIARMIQMFGASSSPKVGIVITDGESLFPNITLSQATSAKADNVNMFAIGVGAFINTQELNGIASSTNQVLSVTDYTALAQQITSLVLEICPTTTQPTTTTPTTTTTTQTTTTTTQPTTTTQTTRPTTQTTSTHPCDGCAMVNGIGYNPHTECDKYIQCEFTTDLTLLRYHVKQCGYGTFWNQDKLTCDHIGNVACDNDPCKISPPGSSYKTAGNCAQYYRCVNGKTQVRTCRSGYSYSLYGYCTTDTSCSHNNADPVGSVYCQFKERTDDKCHYDWVTAIGTYKMACPPGTTFNPVKCSCDTEYGTSCNPLCKPIVDIQFNPSESAEYDNDGALIHNGKAYFNGNAAIRILTLANVDFQSKINIKVRYLVESYSSQTQAVVTNGDCGKQPSISIGNRNNNVQFNLEDTTNANHTLVVNSHLKWRTVEYSLDNGVFTARVNSASTRKNIPDAKILRSKCAFQLGYGTGFQNFKGWIDYITVSTCPTNYFAIA
ncbi:protein PIF [Patella vulgata]|uniref:protein PIF n=1 Tax=Patella vulgata TaxID=6465 RepID=UPI00217F293F|nr:protein PIF [Patella vulgata]